MISVDLKKAADGDTDALTNLFNFLYPQIRKWATKYGFPKEDIEDIAEESIITIFSSLSRLQLQDENKLTAYCRAVVSRRATDTYRREAQKRSNDVSSDADFDQLDVSGPEIRFDEEKSDLEFLERAIAELPDVHRKVVLGTVEGKSIKELAKELGITINSIKTIRYRSMKLLRELYLSEMALANMKNQD